MSSREEQAGGNRRGGPTQRVRVERVGGAAGGGAAIVSSLRQATDKPGLFRGVRGMLQLNQTTGFDCPGCAWPDPDRRSGAEFCENGVKHVAHEATRARADAAFFAQHSVDDLAARPDVWLEKQGRLTEPFIKRADSQHYEPIPWQQAFDRIGKALGNLESPNHAAFYTSGRTSNEAAFLYQLFVRQFGTNNLPDCSNMCHESSGTGLTESIGVGKGTVGLGDFDDADLILVLGQNPGSNHPRMLTTLQQAARRGCPIVSINPLRERGLVRFAHPKDPLAVLGKSTPISTHFLAVCVGGDVALLKGLAKGVLARERANPGHVLDWDFLRQKTEGFDAWLAALDATSWDDIVEGSGLVREDIEEVATLFCGASRVIACWAMGITQHENGVANVQEIVNLMLLRGQIGRRGAGVCPVRGHSNVQGDRTMGIWEKPKPEFLDRLGSEFDFEPPRAHGLDTVATIQAMERGEIGVFFALGGNFAVATPDTERSQAALETCRLTVQVSTVLNRSHLVTGQEAIILPCLGRTELDRQASGDQFVTVENSMSVVHPSRGGLKPASPVLKSEPAIVAGVARATLGASNRVPWEDLVANYDRVRERIARVVPGFERFNDRLRDEGSFTLPSGARSADFETASGRASFRVHGLPELGLEPGQLRMMTLRSHDQFNTTVYSDDDRYRGIHGSRKVVLLHADDLRERGLEEGDRVDITSHFRGETRSVSGFQVVRYEIPRGCAGTYFPEANPLVPVEQHDRDSRTPAYKSVVISLSRSADPEAR